MDTPQRRAHAARPDPRAVLADLPLGRRVVVRRLIEGGERATDSVGELVARDEESVLVATRAGTVRIELSMVVVAKEVPPSPAGGWRVPPFLRRAPVAVLGLDDVLRPFGTAVAPAVELVEELLAEGTPTFILTSGCDRVPTELAGMGLAHLVPALLDAHGPGAVRPALGAYAAAHAEIESRLVRTVGRGEVHFTDGRPAHVDAARAFGWQARVFTLPPDRPRSTRG